MENTYTELTKELVNKKIVIFGSGNFFKKLLKRFPLLIQNIDYIIDNYYKQELFFYNDIRIPVYTPEKLRDENLDNYVVIFCAYKWNEMKMQLDSIISKPYSYYHYPFEIDYIKNKDIAYYHRVVVPIIEELEKTDNLENLINIFNLDSKEEFINKLIEKKLVSVPRIPVVLTPKCSLSCKECNNLMWKFVSYQDLSSEKIIRSLENILNCLDFLPNIELIGGEPFAAKNLNEILDFLIIQSKVLNVEITTNATILPRKELLQSLRNSKVNVRISDYSMVVNQDKFVDCMKENNIRYEKLLFENWIATGGIKKRNRNLNELLKQFYNCDSGYLCKTVWENKLYPCARAASLAELNIYSECPYVDIFKEEKLKERLIHFFIAPTCGPCNYCNNALESIDFVEPAVQINNRNNI